MKSKIVINYGLSNGEKSTGLPFHIVNGIICNYTFVVRKESGVEFDSIMGNLKTDSMWALNLGLKVIDIETDAREEMIEEVRNAFTRASANHHRVVLFQIEKTAHDDTIFYEALGITHENAELVMFESLGINPTSPFECIPIEELV